MQWHGFKIHIILLALVTALVLFWGGQWVYNKLSYQEPLAKALENMESIKEYSINESEDELVIDVRLDQPENLKSEYNKINNSVEQVVNNRTFQVNLLDDRDETLKEAYYNSQFIIQEAIIRGNFREMAGVVHETAKAAGAEARIFVGPRNIYLQMEHNGHHLYEVIPRNTETPGAAKGGFNNND